MNIDALIIFENTNFIIVNKPVNISVHSGSKNVTGLIDLFQNNIKYSNIKLKLAHRLDKNTTGCLILSKNDKFLNKFHDILKYKRVKKEYHALVYGKTQLNFNIITNQTFLNSYNNKIKKIDVAIETRCETIDYYINCSLIKIFLLTGKLHQIRIHLTSIGHPIICDPRYGNLVLNKNIFKTGMHYIFLHASSIAFECPLTFEFFSIKADYNSYFKKGITFFKMERKW